MPKYRGGGKYADTGWSLNTPRQTQYHDQITVNAQVPAGQQIAAYSVKANITGTPGNPSIAEFIGYHYDISITNATDQAGAGPRGLRGTVRAYGGNAELRSGRFFCEGTDGHSGMLTGLLSTVIHSDSTNDAYAPVQRDASFIGEVGPGCFSAFTARSFPNATQTIKQQRPAYGFNIEVVDLPLLPELACFFAHGGGNGDLFRGAISHEDGTTQFQVDNGARVTARGFITGKRTINDDSAITLTPPNVNPDGIILFWGNATASWGMAKYRLGGSPAMTAMLAGSNVVFTTGALTGSTGADGKVTVSTASATTIDIENRLGASSNFYWIIFAPGNASGVL